MKKTCACKHLFWPPCFLGTVHLGNFTFYGYTVCVGRICLLYGKPPYFGHLTLCALLWTLRSHKTPIEIFLEKPKTL